MDSSAVEGLFVRSLKAEGALAEGLKAIGIDVKRLEPGYDDAVFRAGVDVAARLVHAELSETEAHRLLGHALIDGYFDTILGKVAATLVPVLGVKGTLRRLEYLWKAPQPTMQVTTELHPDGIWEVRFVNPAMPPFMVAGVLEAGLARTREAVKVEVLRATPTTGVLLVTKLH